MKKLNLGNINAGLNSLKAATDNAAQNGRFELIDTTLIDFAAKNSYAADDNEESYKELAANIDEVGLLTPLGVIVNGNRYTLFSGERRFRAITTYLHWTKVPCYVFETKSVRKAQLMLHQANASREYTPQRKLQLYEEYRELLEEMKEAGEIKGGMQEHLAKLMGVSERSVRYYKQMQKIATDVTYIKHNGKWYYLAGYLDLFNNEILEWELSDTFDNFLVMKPAERLLKRKMSTEHQVLLHSDQGVQYSSAGYCNLLKEYNVIQSMSRAGNPRDNAVMESFWGRFKDTLRKHFRYWECDDLRSTIEQAIYYFNNERPVRKLKGKPPVPYRTELVA